MTAPVKISGPNSNPTKMNSNTPANAVHSPGSFSPASSQAGQSSPEGSVWQHHQYHQHDPRRPRETRMKNRFRKRGGSTELVWDQRPGSEPMPSVGDYLNGHGRPCTCRSTRAALPDLQTLNTSHTNSPAAPTENQVSHVPQGPACYHSIGNEVMMSGGYPAKTKLPVSHPHGFIRPEDCIHLCAKTIVGRGRDGLVYRFNAASRRSLCPRDIASVNGWGGLVAKVPRFCINEIPQAYVKSLIGGFHNQPHVVKRVREAMFSNLRAEGRYMRLLWKHIVEKYMRTIGFPEAACNWESWELQQPPAYFKLSGILVDDGQSYSLNSCVPSSNVFVMPMAVMDAYYALVNHFSEPLFINFIRDIVFQLQWLEKKRTIHGDVKLSNILLLCWQRKEYVFVLADFWDAFSLTKDGIVEQLDPTRDHPDYALRKLQRWKFHYEKFGTRIYKDPELLEALRMCNAGLEEIKDGGDGEYRTKKLWDHLRLEAGPINMWSFIMILVFLLGRKSKAMTFKQQVRDDILYSGSPLREALPADKAIDMTRTCAIAMNKNIHSTSMQGIARRVIYNNLAVGSRSQEFSDEIRDELPDLISAGKDRPTALSLIKDFDLYETWRIPTNQRNLVEDLGKCKPSDGSHGSAWVCRHCWHFREG